MSKSIDEKNEQKANCRVVPSMSSRQQILYLIKETQNIREPNEMEQKEKEVLDYYNYFMKRKEKIVSFS